jgi:hypothetical protein
MHHQHAPRSRTYRGRPYTLKSLRNRRREYVLCDKTSGRARFGTRSEIAQDLRHFRTFGTLPRERESWF